MMTKPLLAILLLLTVSLRGYSANPDDAAWLIYDVSYGDYFLLRIDMKTSRTGRANIAGGNRYAGRRFTDEYGWFGVSALGQREKWLERLEYRRRTIRPQNR